MTMYRVSIGRNEYRIQISGGKILVDGEPFDGDLVRLNRDGLFLLRRGEEKRELHVRARGQNLFAVMANRRHVLAQVEPETGHPRRRANQDLQGDLVAPMPGMVVNVLVKEDQQVETGEVLVVLESMKMQMELRSTSAGRVNKVNTQPGQHVEKGTLLIQVVE